MGRAGNLLIREEEARTWWQPSWLDGWVSPALAHRPKLVLLDAGMVTELSHAYQEHILEFFKVRAP